MASETGTAHGLRSTFLCYMAEGEQLYQRGEYSKGLRSFSNGLYQKAEALYVTGDFEFALVYYHRGFRLRPELQEFRLGIQKAQEAIENSVGTPASVKLDNKGDIPFLSKQEESKKTKQVQAKAPKKDPKQQEKEDPARSEKTVRQLLGQLYNDKEYLQTLLKDGDLLKGNSGVKLQDLIMKGLSFLDTRTDFWRQQMPIYARERDRKIMQQKWSREKGKPSDPTRDILKNLEEIDQLLSSGKAEESCKKAQQVLKNIQGWTGKGVSTKDELVGNLYSCIGNAQMDMGQMEGALQSHEKDLEIAKEHNLPEAKSRALDNIGRVYARIGKFQEAIKVWEEKIPLASSSLEKTWLFHEIGRCYLELGEAAEGRAYGRKSQQEAGETGDVEWQLNSSVLVAQAEVKLEDYQSAVSNFERALEMAKLLQSVDAEQAIVTALEDANRCMVEQQKSDTDENEEQNLSPEEGEEEKEEEVESGEEEEPNPDDAI
ncbi:hypothetical protein FKM82_019915 [Ascaphus truei]